MIQRGMLTGGCDPEGDVHRGMILRGGYDPEGDVDRGMILRGGC